MDHLNKFCLQLILLISILGVITPQNEQKNDENRPYKFGFNIDGQQHRHEEKDEKGLISGEFGFITADGVYHVTVYATDEQGRFKIVSMKSIKVSPPLDGSPDYSKTPIQNINNNALQTAATPSSASNPFISTVSNLPSNQEYTTPSIPKLPQNGLTITLQKPMKSCSSCSIPTTTKSPPVISPQLPQRPENSQFGLPQNQPVYPNYQQNQTPNQNPISNINYPQNQAVNPSNSQNQIPNQNYPQSQTYPNQQTVIQNVPTNPPSQELIAPFTPNEILPPNLNPNIPSSPAIGPDSIPNDNFNFQPDPPSPDLSSPFIYNEDNSFNSQPNLPSQDLTSPFLSNNENNYNPQSNLPTQELTSPFVPNNNYNLQSSPPNQEVSSPFIPNEIQQNNEPNAFLPPELNISPLPPAGLADNNYGLQPFNPTITSTTDYSIPQTTKKPTLFIPEGLHFPGLIHPPSDPPPGENPTITGPMPPGITVEDMRDLMYKFNYTVGFHGHYEIGYRSGAKVGAYFVNGRDGYSRIVEYTADQYGFHPKVHYVYLGLDNPDTPKEETEKNYGLKGYIFEWYSIG